MMVRNSKLWFHFLFEWSWMYITYIIDFVYQGSCLALQRLVSQVWCSARAPGKSYLQGRVKLVTVVLRTGYKMAAFPNPPIPSFFEAFGIIRLPITDHHFLGNIKHDQQPVAPLVPTHWWWPPHFPHHFSGRSESVQWPVQAREMPPLFCWLSTFPVVQWGIHNGKESQWQSRLGCDWEIIPNKTQSWDRWRLLWWLITINHY